VRRKDIVACVLLGEITAGIFYGLAAFWSLPSWMLSWARLLFLLVPLGALAIVGLGQHLGKQWPAAQPAGRFAVVGTANTLIDLGLLNLCIAATGVLAGPLFALFKAGSFSGAVIHSYCWNANWSFADSAGRNSLVAGGLGRRFSLFLTVTLVGLWVNTSVAALAVHLGSPMELLAGLPWANLAAVLALALSTMWNFFAYRYLVFSPHCPKVGQAVVGGEAVGD